MGGGGYLLYSQVIAPSKEVTKDLDELEDKEETVDVDEVDLDKVNINATENSYCTLAGCVKKASNGSEQLSWGDGLTIYALDSNGDKVLMEDAEHDAAIISTDNGDYLVCVMGSELKNTAAACDKIVELSGLIYQTMIN